MLKIFLIVMLFNILQSVTGQSTKTIAKFKNASDLAKWRIRKSSPATVWKIGKVPNDTDSSAHLIFPSNAGGSNWPAVILQAKSSPTGINWSPYTHIELEVYNPGAESIPLRINITNTSRGHWRPKLMVKPGFGHYTLKLPDLVRFRLLREFHFFVSKPPKPYELYIKRLYLSANKDEQKREIANILERFPKVNDSRITKLKNRLQAADSLVYLGNLRADALELYKTLQNEILWKDIPSRGISWRWADGTRKINPYMFDSKILRKDNVTLELAANESEGLQLVLLAPAGAENVRVNVSDLKAPCGAKIKASSIKITPVGFVNTKAPVYYTEQNGWKADPLLDYLKKFNVKAKTLQSVYLDVNTMKNQKAGVYLGTISIKGNRFKNIKIPLTVKVWNFSLPEKFHLPVSFATNFTRPRFRDIYQADKNKKVWEEYLNFISNGSELQNLSPEAKQIVKIRQRCIAMLKAHHIPFDNLYRSTPPSVKLAEKWRKSGINFFNLFYVPRPKYGYKGLYPRAWQRSFLKKLDNSLPKLQAAGLSKYAYLYCFDEATVEQQPSLKFMLGKIKKKYPDLSLMSTTFPKSVKQAADLADYVDIFVSDTRIYTGKPEIIDEIRKNGKKVWWYVGCEPFPPSANLLIENSGSSSRLLLGFLSAKYKVDGFLYYATNYWKAKRAVNGKFKNIAINKLTTGPFTQCDGRSNRDTNGDGRLIYPGGNGPIASLRLKNIRDGLEDYEYHYLLKELLAKYNAGHLKMPGSWVEKAKALLSIPAQVAKSPEQYTSDSRSILDYRASLAKLIEETKQK